MCRTSSVATGRLAEDLACRHLEAAGYVVLVRRYRTRFGEIDIVARDRRTLVFIEVKARGSRRFGTPFDAITPRKRGRLLRMADDYLARHGGHGVPCRFDVIGIELAPPDGAPRVAVLRNAFGLGDWV